MFRQIGHAAQRRRHDILGALGLVLFISLATAGPAAAGDFSATQVLRSRPDHTSLVLGDMAADGNVAVVWEEEGRSFLRWSEDGGTFASRVPLRNGRLAMEPRVALCGDLIAASSVWPTGAGGIVGIDYGHVPEGGAFDSSRFRFGPGYNPDVACRDTTVAAAWSAGDGEHVMLGIRWLTDTCEEPCVNSFEMDLGPGAAERGLSVAATGRGFVVGWMDARKLMVQRVIADVSDGSLSVEVRPAITVLESEYAWMPELAGDGSRVVLAYSYKGQTRMRVSENRGRSFGPAIVVWDYCFDCPEAGSGPASVDARAGWILVEGRAALGTPTAVEELGFLSGDGGQTWSSTSHHTGGVQLGVLLADGFAEAWDKHSYANEQFYGDVPQKIRYHTGALP